VTIVEGTFERGLESGGNPTVTKAGPEDCERGGNKPCFEGRRSWRGKRHIKKPGSWGEVPGLHKSYGLQVGKRKGNTQGPVGDREVAKDIKPGVSGKPKNEGESGKPEKTFGKSVMCRKETQGFEGFGQR